MQRKSRTLKHPREETARTSSQTLHASEETPSAVRDNTAEGGGALLEHESKSKRPRKQKDEISTHSILEGFKRRKLSFELADVLLECEAAMDLPEAPLVHTPRTFFRSLCGVFELEYPGVLGQAAIDSVVGTLEPDSVASTLERDSVASTLERDSVASTASTAP